MHDGRPRRRGPGGAAPRAGGQCPVRRIRLGSGGNAGRPQRDPSAACALLMPIAPSPPFGPYLPPAGEDCVAHSATVAYSATPQVGVVKPLRAQGGRTLAELLRAPRYEVLPTDNAADLVAAYV